MAPEHGDTSSVSSTASCLTKTPPHLCAPTVCCFECTSLQCIAPSPPEISLHCFKFLQHLGLNTVSQNQQVNQVHKKQIIGCIQFSASEACLVKCCHKSMLPPPCNFGHPHVLTGPPPFPNRLRPSSIQHPLCTGMALGKGPWSPHQPLMGQVV